MVSVDLLTSRCQNIGDQRSWGIASKKRVWGQEQVRVVRRVVAKYTR